MTRFTFQGSGQTSGGGEGLIALAAVGAGAAIVYAVARPAAATLGELLVIIPAVIGGAVLGAVVTLLAVRARGRRRTRGAAGPQVQLWHPNPEAIPVQPRRELPAPVVNVNIDAGLIAGLMEATRQQPVRVVPEQAERQEIPR